MSRTTEEHPALLTRGACAVGSGWCDLALQLLRSPPTVVLIQDARALAAELVLAAGGMKGLSTKRVFELWERFEVFALRRDGVRAVEEVTPALAEAFIRARTKTGAPSAATQDLRRSVIRMLFRTLRQVGVVSFEPTLDVSVPPRARRDIRPLTAEETAACRWASLATLTTTRTPLVWALAESGLWPVEIASATSADVDLDVGSITTAGGPKTAGRSSELTDWAARQLGRAPLGRLAYTGNDPLVAGRTSVSAQLRHVLRRAGLAAVPGINTQSVTATAGRRTYDRTGRIEDAALTLGLSSLDRTAVLIDIDWRSV